jgi:hypothetical protein
MQEARSLARARGYVHLLAPLSTFTVLLHQTCPAPILRSALWTVEANAPELSVHMRNARKERMALVVLRLYPAPPA